jgi:stalled ribosome alternative rescue factor ArfA
MAKNYVFYFGSYINKDNIAKVFEKAFSENIYNSPLFRQNIEEEKKIKVYMFFRKFMVFKNFDLCFWP